MVRLAIFGCATVATLLTVCIFVYLLRESWPALTEVGPAALALGDRWQPISAPPGFGSWHMIIGSAVVTIGAMALAAPLGFLVAVGIRYELSRPWSSIVRRMLEVLAGIPSVVIGLFGLVVLVPAMGSGQGLLPATLILALMVVPTVALLTDSALRDVAPEHRTAAASLGLSQRAMVLHVLVPAARRGIWSAVVLAAGRALGETMAVLMVCGNVVQLPDSLTAPIRTLTTNIALEMGYAEGTHRAALFTSGVLLTAVVVLLVVLAAWRGRSRSPVY